MIAAVDEALTSPSLQYGAFGLCASLVALCFLLWKSNRDERKEMGREIERQRDTMMARIVEKDEAVLCLTRELSDVAKQGAAAMNRLAEALEVRPCLSGDRVFKKGAPQ